jgi:hypothetical protein
VDDALEKLVKDGTIIEEVHHSTRPSVQPRAKSGKEVPVASGEAVIRYQAKPLPEALRLFEREWKDYFQAGQ